MEKIQVVEIGKSGGPEYITLTPEEKQERLAAVSRIAATHLPGAAVNEVLTAQLFTASLACHYWRRELSFEGAVEQVISDLLRLHGARQ